MRARRGARAAAARRTARATWPRAALQPLTRPPPLRRPLRATRTTPRHPRLTRRHPLDEQNTQLLQMLPALPALTKSMLGARARCAVGLLPRPACRAR